MATPLLGWIGPRQRTNAQHDAHAAAVAMMPRFALPVPTLAKGQAVRLFDYWKHPSVVADVGLTFDRIHQLTGSCFPAGTPVRLADGSEKPIEAVTVGDEVVTHEGRARPVTHTMNRRYTGEMHTVHVKGFPFPLEMTNDHKVAVLPGRCEWRWQPGEIEWKRADELEVGDRVLLGYDRAEAKPSASLDLASLLGDKCVVLDELMKEDAYTKGNEPNVPLSNVCMARYVVKRSGIDWRGKVKLLRARSGNVMPRNVPVCPSLARFVGLYLAEGGCDGCKVVFTFAGDEEALCQETLALAKGLFDAEGDTFISNERGTARKVVFNHSGLAAVLKSLIPGDVYAKRVPGVLFAADNETKMALLMGWMAGDGHAAVHGGQFVAVGVTASGGLARDMTTLALSCGVRASCGKRKARGRSRAAYDVRLSGAKIVGAIPALNDLAETRQRLSDVDTARTMYGYARPVTRIDTRPVEAMPVYDFEVEEDHSFVAGGVVVHNCVWAGGTNGVFSTIAAQRVAGESPTKAFLPFTLHNYALSRHYMGDDSQGEGSMGSTFAKSLREDGIRDWVSGAGLPAYTHEDGISVTSREEMAWSSVRNGAIQGVLQVSKAHLFGNAAECKTVQDVKAMVLNGYGVTFACNLYVGNASVEGQGENACVIGYWDHNGGHQQSIHAYWEHPDFGPLYWAQNNWPGDTYPRDPAGGPVCGCWVREAKVEAAMRQDGEVYGLSHLDWFPANPRVLDGYI